MNHQNPSPRKYLYALLSEEEYTNLCTIIRKMAFPSTSAYITAVCRTTLYGWQTKHQTPDPELDPKTAAWILWHKSRMTAEDELRQQFFNVLTDLAFPVIASRGGQLAFHLLQAEIETAMAERTGIVPTFACMKTWMQIYETIHAEPLGRHRAGLAREATEEAEQLRRQEENCDEHGDSAYE
ncbi:MAG: hypothetical protein LBL85_01410 [Methanocalculaceae archaeon]|jgi:hypothetical protein|nr:hypothetical protein [Methanocalculaceae archaeon]